MAIPWIKMFSISSNILHDNGFWYAFQSHMSENLHPIHHLHYAAIWHDYESLYIEMWRWDNMRTNNISQWMRHETMNYISYTIRKWFVYLYIILCFLFCSVIYLFRKKNVYKVSFLFLSIYGRNIFKNACVYNLFFFSQNNVKLLVNMGSECRNVWN